MRITNKDDPVTRLMASGISRERAMRICQRFASEEDASGLKSFVRLSEALVYEDNKERLKEI